MDCRMDGRTAIVTGIPVGLFRCIAARAKHWMLNPQLVRGRLALGWLLTRPAMPSSWQLFYCLLSCSRWWRNSSPELGPLHPALAFWCAAGVAEPSAGLPTGSHETSRAGCRKTPLGSIHAGAGDALLRRRKVQAQRWVWETSAGFEPAAMFMLVCQLGQVGRPLPWVCLPFPQGERPDFRPESSDLGGGTTRHQI